MQSTPAALLPCPSASRAASPGRAPVPVSVFLPKEHGSWSLALEPLALALVLAPSAPGGALLIACLAGFFARRPLKATFDGGAPARRRAARGALILLAILAVTAALELLVLGELTALWPLLLAVPFGALFAWFDAQGEGRAAAAELAGSATFAVLPAVFATLAGWSAPAALTLAALALVRSVPTVLTIRAFLRQRKGEVAGPALPLVASGLGLGLLLLLAEVRLLPWLATGGALLLLVRTVWLTGPWRPAWSARRAGMGEAVLGIVYLTLVAAAYHLGGNFLPAP